MLKISSVGILHDDAEGLLIGVIKTAFIPNHIGHSNRCEEPDLIEGCVFLFLTDSGQRNSFHGKLLFGLLYFYKMDFSETSES